MPKDELHWSANKPTVPGAYWFRTDSRNAEVCRVGIHGSAFHPILMVYFTDGERNNIEELQEGHWAGPIPEPEEAGND